MLCPVWHSPAQKRSGGTGESPAKGHEGDEEPESSPQESWDCSAYPACRRECLGISGMGVNSGREGGTKMEPGFFQWPPVTGSKAMGTRRNTGGSVLSCEGDGALEQVPAGAVGLWGGHSWRYSEVVWVWSWATALRCLA